VSDCCFGTNSRPTESAWVQLICDDPIDCAKVPVAMYVKNYGVGEYVSSGFASSSENGLS
jgi:hypothetical protein